MPESVSLPLEGRLVNQSKLERQVANVAKKAGRNLKIDLGTNAKDIKSLEQPLGRITGQADEFGKSMQAANARVIAFGASVGLINAVVQSFKSLVTTTIEVEKSLAKINSILKTSTSGLSGLKDEIFQIAKGTEQTFNTVADAALELSRQGLSATEVTSRLNDAMILARLSGISAADAVSGLTAAVNSFTKAGLTTGEVLNKISNAANQFAVSERDLIEGFKRSASVAQQAGVSIDELGGIITAVQQKTARGGAVIGNSFKTIFTRIGRADNLDLLKSVGVQVTDLQGKILPATKLIEGLAKQLENLNDVQVRSITEKIGGGFQIAPLIAALSDYSSESSIAIKATEAFRNATDQAYQKNIILNQTLSAAINTTSLSVQDLANRLGELGVTDTFKELLNIFNNLAQKARDLLDGEGIGGELARGITKGLGSALIKGGLAIFGLLLYKLSKQLLKFGVDSFKTFLGLNKEAQKLQSIQAQIVQTLIGDKSIREQILKIENSSLSAENKRAQQAEFFNKALRERVALTSQLNKVSVGVSPLIRSGATKRGAGGFLPIGAEQKDINSGVGGASSGAKPVVIPNFAFGNGKKGTMVANSSEYIVPNFAGGGSAIFNQDMVKSMGLPSGAKKINAAGGFIPNFAAKKGKTGPGMGPSVNSNGQFILLVGGAGSDDPNKTLFSGPLKKGGKVGSYTSKQEADTYLAPGYSSVNVPTYGLSQQERSKNAKGSKTDIDFLEKNLSNFAGGLALDYAKGLSPSDKVPDATKNQIKNLFNKGALSGFAGSIFETGLSAIMSSSEFRDYKSRTDTSRIDLPASPSLFKKFRVPDGQGSGGAEVKNKAGADQLKSTAKKFYDIVVGNEAAFQFKKDSLFGNKFVDRKTASERYGVDRKGYNALEKEYGGKKGAPLPVGLFLRKGLPSRSAGGYIPNFAGGGALEEAIQREKEAGVPINQIRINQDGGLRNSQNPNGLAVTNTRDEPTGAVPKNAARGFVPNFEGGFGPNMAAAKQTENVSKSAEKVSKNLDKLGKTAGKSALAQEKSNNRMIALTGSAFLLQSVFAGVGKETEGFGSKLAAAAEGLSSAVFTQGLLGQVGGDIGQLGGALSTKSRSKRTTARIASRGAALGRLGGSKGGLKGFGLGKSGSALIKLAPIIGKSVSIFTRLIPIVGTLVTAFQVLNPILKSFGIDLLGGIKDFASLFTDKTPKIVDQLEKLEERLTGVNDRLAEGILSGDLSGKNIADSLYNDIRAQTRAQSLGIDTNGAPLSDSQRLQTRLSSRNQNGAIGIDESFNSVTVSGGGTLRRKIPTLVDPNSGIEVEATKELKEQLGKIAPKIQSQANAIIISTLSKQQLNAIDLNSDEGIKLAIKTAEKQLGGANVEKIREAQKQVLRDIAGGLDETSAQLRFLATLEKLIEGQVKKTKVLNAEDAKRLALQNKILKVNKEIFLEQLKRNDEAKQSLLTIRTELEFRKELEKSSAFTSRSRKSQLQDEINGIEIIRKKRASLAKTSSDFLTSNSSVKSLLGADSLGELDEGKARQYKKIVQQISEELINSGQYTREILEDQLLSIPALSSQQAEVENIVRLLDEQLKTNEAITNIEDAKTLLLSKEKELLQQINKVKNEAFQIAEKEAQLSSKADIKRLEAAKARLQERKERNSILFGGGSSATSTIDVLNRSSDRRSEGLDSSIERRRSVESIRQNFTSTAREQGIIGDQRVKDLLSQIKRGVSDAAIRDVGAQLNSIASNEDNSVEGAIRDQIKALREYIEIAKKGFGVNVDSFTAATKQFSQAVAEFRGRGADVDPAPTESSTTTGLRDPNNRTGSDPFGPLPPVGSDSLPETTIQATSGPRATSNPDIFNVSDNLFSLDVSQVRRSIDEVTQYQLERNALINQRDLELIAAKDQATRVAIDIQLQKELEKLEINKQIAKIYESFENGEISELSFQTQIAELDRMKATIESADQTLSQMFQSLGVSSEDATRNIKENLVSGAKQFVDTISDGMVDALVSGGSLKDVLRSAALDFTSGMAKAGLNNLLNQVGFGGGGIGGGGIVGVLASVFGKADGGMIQGMVSGGSGMKDDVPAVLMGGEYVMKKSAVQKYGPNFMNSINNGSMPGFAEGGLVNRLETGVVSSDWTPKANRDFLPYDLPPTTNRADSGVFASRWTAAATKPQGPTPENAKNGKGPATAISEYQQFRIEENEKSRTQSGVLASGWTPKADSGYIESADEEPDREVRTDSGIVASSWTSGSGFERSSKKERVENKSGRVESGLLASRWTPESTQPGFLKTDSFPSILSSDGFKDGQKTAYKFKEGFAEAMSSGQVQKFANGGLVSGSPFMKERTADIFGNIRPSGSFKAQSGAESFYAPGLYNSGSITGSQDLLSFATQGFTSGKNDFIASGNQSSMISLEPESARLTNFGRNRNTPLQDITKGAKEQAFGLDLGYKREVLAYEEQLREIKRQKKAQRKAMLTQLAISVGTMALSSGIAGIKNGVKAAGAAGTSKFMGGLKGFFGGGTLPNQTGTFGGLKNMFSARGTITSGNVGNYIFNNPNSKLTQELLPGVISNAPKAIPIGGGGNVFSNLGNQGSGIMPISSRPNFVSGLLNQGTNSGSSFNFGGIPGEGDGLLPQYRLNNSFFDGSGSTVRPDERFATGGYVGDRAGIDNVSALLSGGEFVLNRAATERVGPESLQQINSGGDSSLGSEKLDELVEKMEELIDATKQNAGEINISVTGGSGDGGSGSSGGTESTETSGEIEQNQLRQEMAQQIKSKVLEVIREEKRLGGSLR